MKGAAYDRQKRAIDITVSAVALLLSAPLQLMLAGLVRAKLGAPVLFRQHRSGKEGRVFKLVKFRTMRDVNAAAGFLSDAQRLTSFGKALRSTSLDELPSLYNILVGDMSLVGPRPLLVQYLDRYSAEQWRRHEVRPGLTGLAQVSGRNALTWDERFRLDVEYIERRSLVLDARIIAITALKVLKRHGISSEGEATMPEFMGNTQW